MDEKLAQEAECWIFMYVWRNSGVIRSDKLAGWNVITKMLDGDHAGILDFLPEFRHHAPEGYFGHYLTMIGALGGRDCTVTGTQFGNYEAVAGTGQAHIWFDL